MHLTAIPHLGTDAAQLARDCWELVDQTPPNLQQLVSCLLPLPTGMGSCKIHTKISLGPFYYMTILKMSLINTNEIQKRIKDVENMYSYLSKTSCPLHRTLFFRLFSLIILSSSSDAKLCKKADGTFLKGKKEKQYCWLRIWSLTIVHTCIMLVKAHTKISQNSCPVYFHLAKPKMEKN